MKRVQLIVCLFLLAGLILVNQKFEPENAVLYGGLTGLGWASVFLFLLGIAFVIAAEDFLENLIFFFRGKVDAKAIQKPRELSPEELAELGLKQYHGPDFPHPIIFTERCIGCQACVDACPHDVLAIVDGVAATVEADQCMEDTACQVECPVNPKACIVLNTTKEIRSRPSPNRDGSNYQTNVPGCFIIGDVSGVPLIKNAVKEGAEVIEHIAANLPKVSTRSGSEGFIGAQYDVAIIGIGPGGASAAMAAHEKGLSYIAIEQEKILSTIEMYPKGKYIFFKPDTKDWFGGLKAVGLGLVKGKYETAEHAPAASLPAEFEKHLKEEVDLICGELSAEIPRSLHAEFLPLLEEKVRTEVTRRLENQSAPDRAEVFAKLRTEISDDLKTKIPGDQRERILAVWLNGLQEKGVKINEQESCKSVKRADDGDHFVVETERGDSKTPMTYTARRIVLAIGLRGAPNRLRLPNEEMKINVNGKAENKVLYALSNPGEYRGKHLIVVGGGNSAVEAAVDLVVKRDGSNITPRPPEEMNQVTLLVRDYLAPTVKFGNKYQLYQMLDSQILDVRFGAAIKEMRENEVVLMNPKTNEEIAVIPNDYIFALIGGERPDRFLKSIGIEIS